MLSWHVVEKDDKENADGTEGMSVVLKDSHGDEVMYSVDQTTFDGLRVGKSYTLSLTPVDVCWSTAVDPAATVVAPEAEVATAQEVAPVAQ